LKLPAGDIGFLNTERDVYEVAEARILIERELSALCAQRRMRKDLRGLAHLISEMQQGAQQGRDYFAHWGMDFHFAIARGLQNRVLDELFSDDSHPDEGLLFKGCAATWHDGENPG
jgi:DNA-binding FadR family transcriptional regulator